MHHSLQPYVSQVLELHGLSDLRSMRHRAAVLATLNLLLLLATSYYPLPTAHYPLPTTILLGARQAQSLLRRRARAR